MCWIVLANTAYGDVVVLTNGDRITGTVDSIDDGRLLIKTEYAGRVPIDLGAIQSLVTDGEFEIKTAETGAEKVQGRFDVIAEQQAIVTEVGEQPVELVGVQRAGQNRLALPGLGSEWSSRADLGLIISNGNSDTQSLNTLLESTLKRDTVQHSVSLLVSKEEAEEETTKDIFDVDYGYKRFVSEKWYASGNAEYFKDELKDVDARITLGAGMGYQFWDNSFGAFSTELGASAVREDLDGDKETNPAIRWGINYNRFFFDKRAEVFHKQSILFIPVSGRGEVLSSSTGMRFALTDRIDSTARVDVNHETEPPPGNSKTDVTYTVGVGIKF